MAIPFETARLLKPAARLAASVGLFLALSQAVLLADPPYGPPGPFVANPSQERCRLPEIIPAPQPGSRQLLDAPFLNENTRSPQVPPAMPTASDQPLPINLATALYMSNARPLTIAFAQNQVELAVAQLQHARAMWLPNINSGIDYYRHDGEDQQTSGDALTVSKSFLAGGVGATMNLGISDAIFLPLAARQQLLSRQSDLEAARNDALATVATAYFDVQEARSRLAVNLDTKAKADELVQRVRGLARGLVPEIEVDRARVQLMILEQDIVSSRAGWRTTSARLNRVLRLNPGAIVVPIEPPQLQVTLIPPGQPVDDLIPIGLSTRPELASRRALVEATLELLKEEKVRPLIPSVVLQGRNGPGGPFNGALFGASPNGDPYQTGSRFDAEIGVVWTIENLGAGNRAKVRERAADQEQAMLEFFNTQDRIAEELVTAHAELESSAAQVGIAETGIQEANITYTGTLRGIGETRGSGDLLQLVNRTQEAVSALQQVTRAYDDYFAAVNSYNRAQFQLYRAMGCPARILACNHPFGELQNVNTSRPASMAPVCPRTTSGY